MPNTYHGRSATPRGSPAGLPKRPSKGQPR